MNPLQVALGLNFYHFGRQRKAQGLACFSTEGHFFVLNTIQFKDYSSSDRSVQGTYSEVSMEHSPCFQRL